MGVLGDYGQSDMVRGWPLARRVPVSVRFNKDLAAVLAISSMSTVVYLRTMPPTVYNLDSAELATGAYTLGIVHPPGYPTYLLLAKLFSLLPFADVGYRLNVMSAVFGALTVALVYMVSRRLACSIAASLSAALFLAFSHFFWAGSVVAEVYTLNTFFVCLLMYLLLLWRDRPGQKHLLVFSFVYGLGFGSHTNMVLLAPGMAAFVLLNSALRRSLLRAAPGIGIAFALGLSVFAYLPVRYAAGALNLAGWFDSAGQFHSADLTTWDGFRWFVTGQLFRPMMFAYDWPGLLGEALRYLRWLWGTFVGVGIVLGTAGFIGLARKRPRDAVVTGLFFVSYLAFYLDYAPIDKETMFLPTYVIWSLWVACGVDVVYRELASSVSALSRHVGLITSLIRVFLVAVPLLALLVNYRYADVSWDRRSRDWAMQLLQEAAPNSIVLGWWSDVQPMIYLQQVEGVRRDVFILSRMAIGQAELEKFLADRIGTTPIYTAEGDQVLTAQYNLQPMAQGYRLLPRGE